jgi:hypothetical protein
MGYIHTLASISFRTTSDGRRLFFPWGVWARGYVISSEAEHRYLMREVVNLTRIGLVTAVVMTLPTVILALAWLDYQMSLLACVAWVGVYIACTIARLHFLVRGLQRAKDRLSLRDNFTVTARVLRPVLWGGTIFSVTGVIAGVLIFILYPNLGSLAIEVVLLCAVCIALYAWMLTVGERA